MMMRITLWFIGMIMVLAGGYYVYTYFSHRPITSPAQLTEHIASLSAEINSTSPQIKSVTSDASTQLDTFTERIGEVSQHTQKVLGSSIQVNEQQKKPLHESAIEYGRYIYCKQVVSQYENEQVIPATSSSETTSTN